MNDSTITVSDLLKKELIQCQWAGTPTHMLHVEEELARVPTGEAEYLVLKDDGVPMAIALIDHVRYPDSSEIGQLSTNPEFQGQGYGSKLIKAAEERIAKKGNTWSVMGVEKSNDRAQKLYERMGYVVYGEELDSWTAEDEHGNSFTHYADTLLLRRKVID